MTGILLAGGKSKRMGKDKAFLEFRGKKLYKYPLALLEKYCEEILISSADKRFLAEKFPVIPDLKAGVGPLGGMLTCLEKATYSKSLIISCDTPFITEKFIEQLIGSSEDYEITSGLNHQNQPEPFPGIYDKMLVPDIENQIASGIYKVGKLFHRKRVNFIRPEGSDMEISKLFFNLNLPGQLKSED